MPIEKIAALADPFLAQGNQYGEGWFLTGEMAELLTTGVSNIVCIQPFACLPNHVVGKSVIKELRRRWPQSNIVAVDYDPGASEVNQLNRIKLMISVAKENLRAGKGFTMEPVRPLALDEVDSKFRPHHPEDADERDPRHGAPSGVIAPEDIVPPSAGCTSCGAVTDDAVTAVAERLAAGVGSEK